MKIKLSLFFTICSISIVFAQNNTTNSLYWKNRKPFIGYWQQDVAYKIKATIDDKKDQIICNDYQLTYTNNSPDTLRELFFHIFSNAFQPNSYYHKLWKGNKKEVHFGEKYEQQSKGTEISNLKVNGKLVETELDNTILKVILSTPILPNSNATIDMDFITYYDKGDMRRRMKMYKDSWGNKHYDGVHWYPSMTVYDRKFGWTTDQHLDKEFYHDYGTFDVELTFPQHYIVEATGILQNENEVLPAELRKKLDISNFKNKPFNSAPSIIVHVDSTKFKTWKFKSKNTHNFIFTADPTYRIGVVEWNGIKCISLPQEQHATKWQESGKFLAEVIKKYSTDFGMYEWPKIIIADANDGMEYSMITLDGGSYPGHQGLIAHEVGHMWYYGQVGSNETYRANMDEGFTQFLTTWFMDDYQKSKITQDKYIQYGAPYNRYFRLYNSYLKTVWSGFDHQLNTHASAYNGALRHGGGYGLVYFKQGTMLYNLQYVLGEELFLKAMKNYFQQWKFAHPYPEDFRNSIIKYTKVDLNWFFDQWFETTKTIDYGIKTVKKTKKTNEYKITFSRKGRMQMPIDFTVVTEKKDSSNFHIPNNWFVKKTNATVLPKWYGWDLLQADYTATIQLDNKIENVIIDPSHLMADVDLRNNKWKKFHQIKFDSRKTSFNQWNKQDHKIGPALSYDKYNGSQIGVQYNTNYFSTDDFFNATLLFNTGLLQNEIPTAQEGFYIPFSFSANHQNNLKKVWKGLSNYENFTFDKGLLRFELGLSKVFRKQDGRNPNFTKFSVFYKSMMNSSYSAQNNYFLYQDLWSEGVKEATNDDYWKLDRTNSSFNIKIENHKKTVKGTRTTSLTIRTPGVLSDYNYSYIQIQNQELMNLGKVEIHSRLIGRFGTSNTPLESSIYLSGANQEEIIDVDNIEIAHFIPTDWFDYGSNTNKYHQGGGLNLRGFSGYLAPEEVDNNIQFAFAGNSGASWSVEADFDKFIKIKKGKKYFHIDSYLFGEIGVLQFEDISRDKHIGTVRYDAGIGSVLTIKFPNRTIKPISIRFDLPFYVSHVEVNDDNIDFGRFVIGVGRTF